MKEFLGKSVPDYIRSLKPYEPGKPLDEVERELGIRRSVKMASNENPLGPSPKALAAVRKAAAKVNFYPEGGCFYLHEKLAKKLSIRPNELVIGNGSNEMIELLFRVLLRQGDNIVISQQAFLMYKIAALGMGVEVREAKSIGYGHDLNAMAKLINRRTKLLFIANPNNPTGTYLNKEQLTAFLTSIPKVPVVMDEAYYEYVEARDYPDTIAMRKKFSNIITLRTFSKAYGLAGLRIGYAVGNPELIDYLNRVRQPFNVNMLAQAGALAALGDVGHIKKSQKINQQGKKQLYRELAKRGIEFYPTEANFILVKVGKGRKVFNQLMAKGVVVRPMDVYGLPGCIRVTIGRKEDNKRFILELAKLLKKG